MRGLNRYWRKMGKEKKSQRKQPDLVFEYEAHKNKLNLYSRGSGSGPIGDVHNALWPILAVECKSLHLTSITCAFDSALCNMLELGYFKHFINRDPKRRSIHYCAAPIHSEFLPFFEGEYLLHSGRTIDILYLPID